VVFSEGEAEGKFFLCLSIPLGMTPQDNTPEASTEGTNSQDGRKHTTKYSTLVLVVARAKGIDSGGDSTPETFLLQQCLFYFTFICALNMILIYSNRKFSKISQVIQEAKCD
jgi:hypothetical protein